MHKIQKTPLQLKQCKSKKDSIGFRPTKKYMATQTNTRVAVFVCIPLVTEKPIVRFCKKPPD